MASPAATAASDQSSQKGSSGSSQMVVVDLESMQPSHLVKKLRKGEGKLLQKVERIVADLVKEGTVSANAQPVVIVVREVPSMPFFGGGDD